MVEYLSKECKALCSIPLTTIPQTHKTLGDLGKGCIDIGYIVLGFMNRNFLIKGQMGKRVRCRKSKKSPGWWGQPWKAILRRPGCTRISIAQHWPCRAYSPDSDSLCLTVEMLIMPFSDESTARFLTTVPLTFGAGSEDVLHVEGCSASWSLFTKYQQDPFFASYNKQKKHFQTSSGAQRRQNWLHLNTTGLGKVPSTISLETSEWRTHNSMVKVGLISKSQARSREFTFFLNVHVCHGAPMKAKGQLNSKCLSAKLLYLSRYLIFLHHFICVWAWKCVHVCVQRACVWVGGGECLSV